MNSGYDKKQYIISFAKPRHTAIVNGEHDLLVFRFIFDSGSFLCRLYQGLVCVQPVFKSDYAQF